MLTVQQDLLDAATPNSPPPPELDFQLSKFLHISPDENRSITFRWDQFQLSLKQDIRQLATERCQDMVNRHGGFSRPQDDEYHSPSLDASRA